MDMSDYQLFSKSCSAAASFPQNIVRPFVSQHHLDAFFRRLNEHEKRLFCRDGDAAVDLWEYSSSSRAFQNTCVTGITNLKNQLEGELLSARDDPGSRFVFIHARNSRERLRISREMFTTILTHYQTMPNFLDFLFPFGTQLYAEDFYFSGFREDSRMSLSDGGLQIPELGRSGRDIRICYSLKSVESIENADRRLDLPWSVRQTALYHSFDVETGKASWVVIKGNHLIRERIQSATKAQVENESDSESFETTAGAFISTLASHLVLCEWSVEDWRWYITSLEKRLQELTRRTLAVDISRGPISPEVSSPTERIPPHPSRTLSQISKRTLSFPRKVMGLSVRQPTHELESLPESVKRPSMSGPPMLPPVLPPGMGGPSQPDSSDLDDVVSVSILQRVQAVEDKATEVLLSLTTNIKVVDSIMEHYNTCFPVLEAKCSSEFRERFAVEKNHFKRRISNVLRDLDMARSSAETLLNLVQRRKELLRGLLDLRNIEASQRVAKESHVSTLKMERMTTSMQEIARKTKQETVSMRIITLVTLFFLPGTFISTIMSTDIIQFQSSQESGKIFQLGALQLYLVITIPLMLITFGAWFIVYKCIKRREARTYDDNH